MKTTLLLCLLLWPLSLTTQETGKSYTWPLTIDNGISSTFQEFRANHFHAGLDLRTFQRTGYPVLAIADGVIEEISVSRTGMGLAVYLRHSDGNTSIYGHLEKFCDRLEALVDRERLRSGEKYFGRYPLPEPIAVRRGEPIAFSGESGYGFPHLHLEIRDPQGGALNPLSWIADAPADAVAPRIKGIILRSRGRFLLNGGLGEFYVPLRNQGSVYTLAEPLAVTGPFDLSLQAYDIAGGRQKVAPYSLDAYLDGQLYYRVFFERLVREDNNQLGMLYDMSGSANGTYFFKLFSQSGFALEKLNLSLASALDLLDPGDHEIRVIVKDRQQNQAVAVLPLRKLSVQDAVLRKEYATHAADGRALAGVGPVVYVHRDDVAVTLPGFPFPPEWIRLKVRQGGHEQTVAAGECGSGVFFCFKPQSDELHVQLRFVLSDGRQAVEELNQTILLLVLQNGSARRIAYNEFLADFAAATVLEPTVMRLERVQAPADFPMLAGPLSVTPVHFTFLDSVFFKFRIPPNQPRHDQLGIFKYLGRGKAWRYMQTQKAPEKGFLACRVLTGGTYAILRDVDPPRIRFRVRRCLRLADKRMLVVHLSDLGKGIAEETIAVFINGGKAEYEYDPDRGRLLIEAGAGVRRGENELLVRATDNGGNLGVATFRFRCR